jgi:hypothetical protein
MNRNAAVEAAKLLLQSCSVQRSPRDSLETNGTRHLTLQCWIDVNAVRKYGHSE